MSELRENLKKIGFSDDLLDKLIDKHLDVQFTQQEIRFKVESVDSSNLVFHGDKQPSSQNIILKKR